MIFPRRRKFLILLLLVSFLKCVVSEEEVDDGSGSGSGNSTTELVSSSSVGDNFTTVSTTVIATGEEDNTTTTTEETSVEISTVKLPENVAEELPDECSSSLELARGFGYFTASDWSPGSAPNDARLNGRGGWIGGFGDVHYLQVDLGSVHNISGLRLQPHSQWPKNVLNEYRILHSQDGYHWKQEPEVEDRKINSKFNKTNSESLNIFSPTFLARFVVINPIRWNGIPGPALRMELYGCRTSIVVTPVVPVIWRGDIQSDQTWDAGPPYLIHQPIRILPGVTLTISPGVEILFGNRLSGIFVEGTLVANGTKESPITMQAYDVMSYLTVAGFWRGITFVPGGSPRSSLSHVIIQGAEIGVYTSANLAIMSDLTLKGCECGVRVEGGRQEVPDLISTSDFRHNDHGLQIYNVTGNTEFTKLNFHANKYISISISYPTVSNAGVNKLTLSDINVNNSTYAVSISGYQPLITSLSRLDVTNVEYGVFLEFSDAVSLVSTIIEDSSFNGNSLYGVYVDFKRYARYKWYGNGGNFTTQIVRCNFQDGANGMNYYGPEALNGNKSTLEVKNNKFQRLLSAVILRLEESSYYLISDNTYRANEDRVLDVTYNAIDISGDVTSNVLNDNVPQKDSVDSGFEKLSLIGFFGNINAQTHGVVNFQYNKVTNNSFPRILETNLMKTKLSFNVLENKAASCELCISLGWIHGGGTINASHNWWGHESIIDARSRVNDFFVDMDRAAADITPILKEPRVRGASWGSETMHLTQGSSFTYGGIVDGNLTFSQSEVTDVKRSILVPVYSSLRIMGGSHLRFEKNTGILVEGELYLDGNEGNPVVFDSLSEDYTEPWKGIRLMYSQGAYFKHVAVTKGYGVQCVGYVPEIDGLDVTYSTGPGLWLYVIQPDPITLKNSYFVKNDDGVYLQIQGNESREFNLKVVDCHFDENEKTGLILQAGNLVSNVEIMTSSFINNGAFGMTLNISDGSVLVEGNNFNQSVSGARNIRGTQLGTQVNVHFDANCQFNQTRIISLTNNTFFSASTPLRGVYFNSACVNGTSAWAISNNKFINTFDDDAGEAASVVMETTPSSSTWPLSLAIFNNLFECVRQYGVAMRLNAFHGEDVMIYGNNIFGCGSPAQIVARYNPHRLAVTRNRLINCGPVVLHTSSVVTISANGTSTAPSSLLDFSYNNVSRGNGSATLKTTGYNAEVNYNFFENPAAKYDLWVGDLAPVNATLNWWGTEDFNRILSRVLDGRTDFTRAEAVLFPCLLSANYSHVSTAFPDVFQIVDQIVGGSVNGNVSLPSRSDEYIVQYPIRIPYGSSLSIPAGTKLRFRNHTGIYALGHLALDGTSNNFIEMTPAEGTTSWKGITIGKPRLEYMRVRLSGSTSEDTGRVEAFVEDSWVGVCSDKFDRADAYVVCKELGFVDYTTITAVPAGTMKIGLSNVRCTGLEMSLLDCESVLGPANCPDERIAVIGCRSQNANRVRRSITDGSDNLPTIVNYVKIIGADVGLQIDDIDGIELNGVQVLKSRGPGVILNPKSPNGASVFDSIISDGRDVGMDIQGAGPISMTSTNITNNNYTGLNIASLFPGYSVVLTSCSILDNSFRGVYVNAEGRVNMSHIFIQRNGDLGASVTASSMSFYKTLIEDHKLRGANLNSTKGFINIENTAFVNNGGTDVDVALSVAANSTDPIGLGFIRSALVNSTYNSRDVKSKNYYAMYVTLTSFMESEDFFPIVFSDCRVLDAYDDGLFIKTGRSHLNVQVTNCKFERINGTAVYIESKEISPELNIESNEFNFVEKETVEVEVRS